MRCSVFIAASICSSVLVAQQQPARPQIPTTWDESALASLEVPGVAPGFSPHAVSAKYYYSVPVRPVFKTYPVYAPGKEPAGYFEWLRSREPQIVFNLEGLHSDLDWIKA